MALMLAAMLAAPAARADLWSFDSSVETRLESNDNIGLSADPAGTVYTLAVTTFVVASRRLENAATTLNAVVTALEQRGPGASDRVDGRLSLSQSLSDLRNNVNLAASFAQDFNSDVIGSDVTQGIGRRRTAGFTASWSHAWSERLSASTQVSHTSTGYGQELSAATDYRSASVSAGLTYLLSELSSATVQLGHSRYRTESGDYRSDTDSIDLGFTQAFSERSSASLSLGTYRTDTSQQTLRLACPLQVAFCEAGLVSYIVVAEPLASSRTGLQFNNSARLQFDELTGLGFSAARQQAPSGAGRVVRSDTLSLSLNRSLSPTVAASVSYGESRSSAQDGGENASSGQKTLAVTLVQQLAPTLSLQGGWRYSSADRSGDGQSGRSNALYVSLKYDWAKIEASR